MDKLLTTLACAQADLEGLLEVAYPDGSCEHPARQTLIDLKGLQQQLTSEPGEWMTRHMEQAQRMTDTRFNASTGAVVERLGFQPSRPWDLHNQLFGNLKRIAQADAANRFVKIFNENLSLHRMTLRIQTEAQYDDNGGSYYSTSYEIECWNADALPVDEIDTDAFCEELRDDLDPAELWCGYHYESPADTVHVIERSSLQSLLDEGADYSGVDVFQRLFMGGTQA